MPEEHATVRDLIRILTEEASAMPSGLDSRLELGICDRAHLQFIDSIDVQHYRTVRKADLQTGVDFVIIRGHWHPGESPGAIWTAASEDESWGGDWDQGLRDLGGE